MRGFRKPWIRPAAFLATNGVVVLLLGAVLIAPAIEFLQDQRQRIEQKALALERARTAISRNEAVAAISPEQIGEAAHRFIQGNGEGLQNADLLKRLRRAAEEQGVSLGSAAALPPREWSNRRLIGARIEFTAPAERAARLLSSLEYGPALLFIDRATLSPEGEAGTIGVTAEVYGVAQWPEG